MSRNIFASLWLATTYACLFACIYYPNFAAVLIPIITLNPLLCLAVCATNGVALGAMLGLFLNLNLPIPVISVFLYTAQIPILALLTSLPATSLFLLNAGMYLHVFTMILTMLSIILPGFIPFICAGIKNQIIRLTNALYQGCLTLIHSLDARIILPIRRYFNIDAKDRNGNTSLMSAILIQDQNKILALLRKGATIDETSKAYCENFLSQIVKTEINKAMPYFASNPQEALKIIKQCLGIKSLKQCPDTLGLLKIELADYYYRCVATTNHPQAAFKRALQCILTVNSEVKCALGLKELICSAYIHDQGINTPCEKLSEILERSHLDPTKAYNEIVAMKASNNKKPSNKKPPIVPQFRHAHHAASSAAQPVSFPLVPAAINSLPLLDVRILFVGMPKAENLVTAAPLAHLFYPCNF